MTKHVNLVIHQLQPEQFPFNCHFHVTQNQALTGILTPRAEVSGSGLVTSQEPSVVITVDPNLAGTT